MQLRFVTLLIAVRYLVVSSLALLLSVSAAHATWLLDGNPVCTAKDTQQFLAITPDGAGGAILVWADGRGSALYTDIYAQRVNGLGVPQWTADGVAVTTATDSQTRPCVVSDGSGGAIVAWEDYRAGGGTSSIYVQRVSAAGAPQWTANGVALATGNYKANSKIVSDGAGGAVVSWEDFRAGNYDVYARRINASGVPQWTADGVALCTAVNNQQEIGNVSDGAGGAILTWKDFRSGQFNIYARRINSAGVPQWTADGVLVCGAAFDEVYPSTASDGAGGAIVTWNDYRSGTNYDVYAQRVNGSGVPQWTTDGVGLCTQTSDQFEPRIVADGTGGAIVSWADLRPGNPSDVYARRVSASGVPLWTADGVLVCGAANGQTNTPLVSDGAGGAIVAWLDGRTLVLDVYARKITAAGMPTWTYDGSSLCTASDQQYNLVAVSDGAGGAIAAWQDNRSGIVDIFAQRVEGTYGYWGHPEPTITSVADIKKDQGGRVALNWTASGRDLVDPRAIGHYSIWRAVNTVPMNADGTGPAPLSDLARVGVDAEGPVYTAVATPQTSYYWELVGTQEAHGWDGYSFAASTRADSVAGNTGNEFFMVAAHYQYDDFVAFQSNVLSGHSVDNLAPAAPLSLIAQRIGNYVYLKWNRPNAADLRDYAVYRKTSSGVTPVPINFLASANDTVLTDASAPGTALYYIVTAYDVHANQGAPSNEASVGATTGIGNTPPITALTVLTNHPNPFAGATELRVGLPANSDVSIDVFDVAGRRVRTKAFVRQQAGWRTIPFDGRDDRGRSLASGVYFYRVSAGGKTVTNKMVIAR
jgi:hypothetical protein